MRASARDPRGRRGLAAAGPGGAGRGWGRAQPAARALRSARGRQPRPLREGASEVPAVGGEADEREKENCHFNSLRGKESGHAAALF